MSDKTAVSSATTGVEIRGERSGKVESLQDPAKQVNKIESTGGQVSGSQVTDARQPATAAAQGTVDKLFPSPILEEGTWFDRTKNGRDNNFSSFDPMNTFPFTNAFRKLAPSERFIKSGWTPDLASNLADLTVSHIGETGGKGEFGIDSSHRQDVRTALKIAGTANHLEDFILQVNARLKNNPTTKRLSLDIQDISAKEPMFGFLGRHQDAYLGVAIKGGRGGDWRNQFQSFDDDFLPHHSKDFVALNLKSKFEKTGWTPELAGQIRELVANRVSATGAQHSFGLTSTEYSDSRSALSLAQDAGKLDETINLINQDQRMKHAATLERINTRKTAPLIDIQVEGGKAPLSTIHLSQ